MVEMGAQPAIEPGNSQESTMICSPSREFKDLNTPTESVTTDLPQPSSKEASPYRYMLFDDIERDFFPGELPPKALCWVMLSKGKGKTPQLFSRARVMSEPMSKESRILVQYPKSGSTYNVRRDNLVPVLEHENRLIIVASETNDYRRTSIVQTTSEDHFLEIGCDFGITVDHVDAKTRLGVDKSEESIRIAKERYPSCQFLLGDVFDGLNITLEKPSVVSMDINGNRELPAVLGCIQVILDTWSPRIIIVKSRELYAKLSQSTSR